jgi:hypothetical protein
MFSTWTRPTNPVPMTAVLIFSTFLLPLLLENDSRRGGPERRTPVYQANWEL